MCMSKEADSTFSSECIISGGHVDSSQWLDSFDSVQQKDSFSDPISYTYAKLQQ